MTTAVLVEGLRKRYRETEAVRGIGFEIVAGEIFALLGPNGAGKTTTLEILEGFRNRDGGRVEVLGRDPGRRADNVWLRGHVGLVLQDIAVESYLTVRETVTRNASYYPNARAVDEVIELTGLADKARMKVKELSGGQKRRLDLALGVIGNPRLIFLDEPTTGFDPSARHGAWDVVRNLRDVGTTIMLTTHYMDEAQALADRVAVISAGQIIAQGLPDSIGGRDSARKRIRFLLPENASADELPLAVVTEKGAAVCAEVDDVTTALHELTGWALRRGIQLAGLTVEQPSLEDVYLDLTERNQP